VSVDDPTLDSSTQPCAHSQYFLSEDDGATWRRVQHTSIAPAPSENGDCQLWSTSRHLFMYTYTNNDQGHAFLERSDDGGRTWTRADNGLSELHANWYPWLLDASGGAFGALVGAKPDLWITRDAGETWRQVGPIVRDATGIGTVSELFSEASLGGGAHLCRCVYAVAEYPGYLGYSVGRHVFVSHDDIQWSPLPPLPITGASVTRSGVYQVLDLTADGKLLALGADPRAGPLATPDKTGRFNGPPPRLWAWDSHTGRWELAESRLPCQDLQTCAMYASGAAAVERADGSLRGTVLWLTQTGVAADRQIYFRLFIPTA
jgi:hypothetical protein